jgi:glycosyltransferase involved in cell wall biosynthesis
MSRHTPSIAILIPCFNEALSIEKVVRDFRSALPDAAIYVFDNNSTDDTARLAARAGATVVREKRQGKGYVVASMLNRVSADYFVMVDGDDTYPAERVMDLLSPLFDGEADMVVGQRLSLFEDQAFRPLHLWGNRLVRRLINLIFSARLTDIMSGYRAFTREVADNLPVVASGFEVETEMTLQLLYRRFIIREVPVPYRPRPVGSLSKLRTIPDGIRVLMTILGIFKAYKPMTFFGSLAILVFVTGSLLGSVVVYEYVSYRYVYSVPKAILAAACIVISLLLASVGVILHTLNFRILEMTHVTCKQLAHIRSPTQRSTVAAAPGESAER